MGIAGEKGARVEGGGQDCDLKSRLSYFELRAGGKSRQLGSELTRALLACSVDIDTHMGPD